MNIWIVGERIGKISVINLSLLTLQNKPLPGGKILYTLIPYVSKSTNVFIPLFFSISRKTGGQSNSVVADIVISRYDSRRELHQLQQQLHLVLTGLVVITPRNIYLLNCYVPMFLCNFFYIRENLG